MTTAAFSKLDGRYSGLCVSGHSGYGENGFDIVCSAISSAVYLTANNLIEIYGVDADFSVADARFTIFVKTPCDSAHKALEGLCIHLCQLSCQYPEFLQVRIASAKTK